MGGAYGWTDNFRLALAQKAWETIQINPFFGQGYGLNVNEAISIIGIINPETQIEMLALGRSYHNSLLCLAVTVGLPATLIFLVVGIIIPDKPANTILIIIDIPIKIESL